MAPVQYDPDDALRRVRRNGLLILGLLAAATAVLTGSVWQVLGLLGAGLLVLLNFSALAAVSRSILGSEQTRPGPLQLAFLAGRHVLLGIALCGIVLLPGVGPVPVVLGLSVLVFAILLEAVLQLSVGADRRP